MEDSAPDSQAPTVMHVCCKMTAEGSRLRVEQDWDSGAVLIAPWFRLNLSAIRSYLSRDADTFVFHEAGLLPPLVACALLRRARPSLPALVYDVHDLVEFNPRQSRYGRAWTRLALWLQRRLRKTQVRQIAATQGLSRIVSEQTGKPCETVYSIPPKSLNKQGPRLSEGSGAVYFGLISAYRLPLDLLRQISSAGYSIDFHGKVIEGTLADSYQRALAQVVADSGGHIHPAYRGDDLSFLQPYAFSLMIFLVDRKNIEYCMPNKLFQSLSQELACVVAPGLTELREAFEDTGAVVTIDQLLDGAPLVVDWPAVADRIETMRESSRLNYLDAIGADVSQPAS